MSAIHARDTRSRFGLGLAAIVALAALLSFYRLGAADVCGFNEAVEGVFVQQMVEHGQWLFPLDNGRAPLYKPPLFHWTALALDRITGVTHVTAFNLRRPTALYAVAGVALTAIFAYELLGATGGLLAGLILCASYQYIENARIGRVDMTLCFFETVAIFSFGCWVTRNSRQPQISHGIIGRLRTDWFRFIFAGALGLAVLAKGPVGALLPMLAGGVFLLAERRLSDVRRLLTPGPVFLAVGIGVSWYAACFFGGRYGFLNRQLDSENFGRFFGALGAMAPWYYLKPILLNSVPFSLLVPVAVYAAVRMRPDHAPDVAANEDIDRIRAVMRLLAIFWIVTVLFFTIAAYKRRAYLLPLWPASAVLLAWWIRSLVGIEPSANNGFSAPSGWSTWSWLRTGTIVACGAAILFNLVYLPRKEIGDCRHDSMHPAATEIDRIVGRDEPLYIYKLGDEPASLIFYLDRNAPPIGTRLGDAPPGYVIAPVSVWQAEQESAPEWTPVFESKSGKPPIVLLRHGPALAFDQR